MSDTVFVRFTDAPEGYDYCNTTTIGVVGIMSRGIGRGNPVRKVAIKSAHSLAYQAPRYQSGLHLCMDLAELERIHDLIGEIDLGKAREGL